MEEGMNIVVKTTDYKTADSFRLQNGDRIRVRSIYENKQTILVEGALFGRLFSGGEPQVPPTTPIVVSVPFIDGITLLQVIDKFGGITPLAAAENSLIIRESTKERIPVDVKKLMETRSSTLDVALKPEDHIFIPMKKLLVAIGGEVVNPGGFPYQTGAKVIDYIKLAGGIRIDSADIRGIYLMDETGRSTLISLETEVSPGALIYVSKSGFTNAVAGIQQWAIIIGFTASLIGLAAAVLDVIARINGPFYNTTAQ
jgi:hypothetical protein